MAKRESVFNYVKKTYHTQIDYPWKKYPNYAVLRNNNSNKWFGIVMDVKKEQLGLKGEEKIDILNVKAQPELIGSLRLTKGFLPAYHMNKEHWVSILLDGSVSIKEIKRLIDTSFDLTKK